MLPRTLEPEVMDTAEEAANYDAMDHAGVNRAFVDDLIAAWFAGALVPAPTVLDLGTGTAQIPIELAGRGLNTHITAVDLAEHMLALAEQNVEAAGFGDAISLRRIDAKSLPFADGSFDIVMSNSIVHHIPEPAGCLGEMVRVLKPGGLLFVRDLMRPDTIDTVEHLVDTYAADENPHQQQLFRQSLHAALTLEEITTCVIEFGLPGQWAAATSDRHWTVCGRQD